MDQFGKAIWDVALLLTGIVILASVVGLVIVLAHDTLKRWIRKL